MFNSVNTLEEHVLVIFLMNGDQFLQYYRPCVVRRVSKMDRDAGDLGSVRQSVPNRVRPRKCGQERRMQIDHGRREGPENWRADQTHIAGQNDQFDPVRTELFQYRGVESFAGFILPAIDPITGNAGLLCPNQAIGVRAAADNDTDFSRKIWGLTVVDNGLEVGSTSGDENADYRFIF